jgi:Protein of unknown function (DUF2924)
MKAAMMSTETEELQVLEQLTTNELSARYLQLFGQPVRTRHKAYLVRKIAWRMQSLAQGDLSERARRRAAELANDADARVMPPRPSSGALRSAGTTSGGAPRVLKAPTTAPSDPRLPAVGTAIVRPYKGRSISVIVRDDGFEHDGQHFNTLSAVAKHVSGSHVNGFRFFRLESKR